jgi:hypothetical protein
MFQHFGRKIIMSFVIQITDRVERPRYLACTFGCGPTVLGICKKGDFLALFAVSGLITTLAGLI